MTKRDSKAIVEENAKIPRTRNDPFPTKYYIVFSRVVRPVYDVHVFCNHDLYLSKNAAIAAAKEEFFEEVHNCFRGGADLDFKKIETYTKANITKLWKDCDTQATHTEPGGPAIVEVIEFDMSAQDQREYKRVIYSLPKGKNEPNVQYGMDDEDNEDEDEE